MAMLIDAKEILQNFQMDTAVTVLVDPQIVSHDPVLPANIATPANAMMSQFIQGAGGWDDVNHATWFTTVDIPKGTKLDFAGKTWTIVGVADYAETSFTNAIFYKLQESATLQAKPNSESEVDKWA